MLFCCCHVVTCCNHCAVSLESCSECWSEVGPIDLFLKAAVKGVPRIYSTWNEAGQCFGCRVSTAIHFGQVLAILPRHSCSTTSREDEPSWWKLHHEHCPQFRSENTRVFMRQWWCKIARCIFYIFTVLDLNSINIYIMCIYIYTEHA